MSETELGSLRTMHKRGELSRREFLRRGLILGFSLAFLGSYVDKHTMADAADNQLNVLGWGGSYQDALVKWVSTPFEAASGAKVVFQAQGYAIQSLGKMQAEKAKPTIDVWLTTTAMPLLLAKSGGLQELTPDKVPNLSTIYPFAVQKYQGKAYASGIHLNANLIIVDRERIKTFIPNYTIDMLKSWTFLYRPELKNQIGIAGFGGEYGATMIGMSKPYGGSETDEEKFFAAMRKLAPNVHTVKSSSVGWAQQFASKEIVAAEAAEADATAVLKTGAAVDIAAPQDPLVIGPDYVVAIENGPAGSDLALRYINEMLRPDVMGPYCNQIGVYSPNSKAATAPQGLPPITAQQMAKGWIINYDAAIANYDAWNERYNKEIVPLYGR